MATWEAADTAYRPPTTGENASRQSVPAGPTRTRSLTRIAQDTNRPRRNPDVRKTAETCTRAEPSPSGFVTPTSVHPSFVMAIDWKLQPGFRRIPAQEPTLIPCALHEEATLATFTDRMLGAAKLDARIYEEVEADTTATGQAASVVALASVAGGIGSLGLGTASVGVFLIGAVASLVSWVIWAFLTYIIGTRLLPQPHTRANMGEMLRALGFAQAPGLARVLGVVPGLGTLIQAVVSLWMLAAMVVAVRQALDYSSTGRAVLVCLVGWLVAIVIPGLLLLSLGFRGA